MEEGDFKLNNPVMKVEFIKAITLTAATKKKGEPARKSFGVTIPKLLLQQCNLNQGDIVRVIVEKVMDAPKKISPEKILQHTDETTIQDTELQRLPEDNQD